jgi:hypothetical protein
MEQSISLLRGGVFAGADDLRHMAVARQRSWLSICFVEFCLTLNSKVYQKAGRCQLGKAVVLGTITTSASLSVSLLNAPERRQPFADHPGAAKTSGQGSVEQGAAQVVAKTPSRPSAAGGGGVRGENDGSLPAVFFAG